MKDDDDKLRTMIKTLLHRHVDPASCKTNKIDTHEKLKQNMAIHQIEPTDGGLN